MKEIARIALKPGMVIGADIFNYQNKLIVPEGTQVNSNVINKLARHSVVSVPVKEETAHVMRYSEKVRSGKSFSSFQRVYRLVLPIYRKMMTDYVFNNIPFSEDKLMDVYHRLYGSVSTHESVLDCLYNMDFAENDGAYTHGINCALLSGLFASWLSLSREKTRFLILGGFLHDIGNLKLPENLLKKKGALTGLEYEKTKTHTFMGFELLQNLPVEDPVLKATLMHHEHYDGTGYPSRLHDKQIDIYARYMAIIDAFEAMISVRSQGQMGNPFEAVAAFEKDSLFFDPELLQPILYRLANHMTGFHVLLSNGQVVEVMKINSNAIGRPIVQTGNGDYIDLVSHKNLTIRGFY